MHISFIPPFGSLNAVQAVEELLRADVDSLTLNTLDRVSSEAVSHLRDRGIVRLGSLEAGRAELKVYLVSRKRAELYLLGAGNRGGTNGERSKLSFSG